MAVILGKNIQILTILLPITQDSLSLPKKPITDSRKSRIHFLRTPQFILILKQNRKSCKQPYFCKQKAIP